MKFSLLFVIASFFTAPLAAQTDLEPSGLSVFSTQDAKELKQFVWKKRPLVVFADSPADPRFIEQMELLNADPDALMQRDVVVLTDTDPTQNAPLRLKLRPRGFMLVIMGKDGGVKLRKPFPWNVREISRSIDKTPLRKQELREEKRKGLLE